MIHQIFINIGRGELKEIIEFSWPQKNTEIFFKVITTFFIITHLIFL